MLTNQGKTTLIRRPLKCLYLLECNSGEKQASEEINTNKKAIDDEPTDKEVDNNDVNDLPDLEGEPATGRTRPLRHAAHRANEFIDAIISDDNCDNEQ